VASIDASAQLTIPKSGKLTCDRIVSASVRRKFFADHTLRDVQDMSDSDSIAYCLIDQEGAAFSIEVDCAVGAEQAIRMERHMHIGWKPSSVLVPTQPSAGAPGVRTRGHHCTRMTTTPRASSMRTSLSSSKSMRSR
jgi:hypothetical protein